MSLLWAFAENPKETFSIVCHVISCCTYDLILGNGFLTATKTLTKFCHRLTRCLFSVVNNVPHFNFLGETCQRLEGTLANKHSVLAIPDTGADRNIMSLQYAVNQGFDLKIGQNHSGYLQFADGSYDKTVGQVETYWTFANGVRIPVTFEILEHCCSDVIIGEKILTEQNVSVKHSASVLLDAALDGDDGDDSYDLAPFDFMNSWQRLYRRLKDKTASLLAKGSFIRPELRRYLLIPSYQVTSLIAMTFTAITLASRSSSVAIYGTTSTTSGPMQARLKNSWSWLVENAMRVNAPRCLLSRVRTQRLPIQRGHHPNIGCQWFPAFQRRKPTDD